MKSQEVNFQKSQKLLASRAGSSKQTKAAIDIEWIAIEWIGCLHGARSVSSFCDFRKMTFRDLTAFSPYWRKKILCFSDILIKEFKAYLCPNITDFDSVDFSECRPEEVISFFWRSVYVQPKKDMYVFWKKIHENCSSLWKLGAWDKNNYLLTAMHYITVLLLQCAYH